MKAPHPIQSAAIRGGLQLLHRNPEKNFARLVRWSERFASRDNHQRALDVMKRWLKEPDHPAIGLVDRAMKLLNMRCKEKLIENFLLNATLKGRPLQDAAAEKYDMNVPWAILMDPTSACNLNCIGCWAAEYDQTTEMDFTLLDRIILEGKELGIYMYLYSGGEPLLRRDDLLALARKHDDCMFLAFTNATLIDDSFAAQVAETGNLGFAISVEGFRNETDQRRGQGTFQKTVNAMRYLKKHGVLFGFSTCYHRLNTETIGSDDYVDFMMNQGCLFGWYFTYIPLGAHARTELMTTPEQRQWMFHRIHALRREKPLFLIDIWNDGIYTDGCIAGGRNYLHINANGDVEPCAFVHYSTDNIREKSLKKTLMGPLLQAYRKDQPFNCNHLRPCPLLDNPEKLTDMVRRSGAVSTQYHDHESAETLESKTKPAACAWKASADHLWDALRQQKQA